MGSSHHKGERVGFGPRNSYPSSTTRGKGTTCVVCVQREGCKTGGEARAQNRGGKGSAAAPSASALHACNSLFIVGLQVSSPKTELRRRRK